MAVYGVSRKLDSKVERLLAIAEDHERTRSRNRKSIERLIQKAIKDSDKVELAFLLEGAAQRVRKLHEIEQLLIRTKFGLKGSDGG
jgi:hypothetical protein